MNAEEMALTIMNIVDSAEREDLSIEFAEPDQDMRTGGSWFEIADANGVQYTVLVTKTGAV